MNYVVGDHYDRFIQDQIASGRFESGEEVVCAGLRLMEIRETKLRALREELQAALDEGGSFTDDEVDAFLAANDTE